MPSKLSRSIRLTTTALISAAIATLLFAGPAAAHDNLLDSTPSAGDTVASLEAVSLTFSGELIDFGQASFAQIQGPDGLYYETLCSTIDLNVLTTPVALGEAGTYTILWNAVSSDGHPISESFQFQYAPEEGAEPALGWDLPACQNEQTRIQPGAVASASPTPTQSGQAAAATPAPAKSDSASDGSSEGMFVLVVLGGVFVLAAVIAMAVWLIRARGRRSK